MQDTCVVEVSWEVANKVGGIHTVLSSRSQYMREIVQDYIAIGPLLDQESKPDTFVPSDPPEHIRQAIDACAQRGIRSVYGTWNIPGTPACVLIGTTQAGFNPASLKAHLYEAYGLDTIQTSWGFDEPLQWAWCVGAFIEALSKHATLPVITQFHEWMAGLALLYLKQHSVQAKTIFTTHATMLGRTISGATHELLHEVLARPIDPLQRARDLRVLDKHTAEVACAHQADIFSTVSDTTAHEARILLGRKPDFVLYNGLDLRVFGSWEQLQEHRTNAQHRIRENALCVLGAPAFPNKKRVRVFYTSGRYEYKNKGMDVIVPALKKLNDHLLETQSDVAVLMLFAMMSDPVEVDRGVMWRKSMFEQFKREAQQCGILESSVCVQQILFQADMSWLMTEEREPKYRMQTRLQRMGRPPHPPMSTHYLRHPEQDPILDALAAHELHNFPDDAVQAVLVPLMLDGFDGVFNEPYYSVVCGCDLGIFPSLYEPWGYTPLESIALGVPTVSTTLAGFGQFMEQQEEHNGVWVVDRSNQPFDQTVQELFEVMRVCCESSDEHWQQLCEQAKQTSLRADWQTFIKRYEQMYSGEGRDGH